MAVALNIEPCPKCKSKKYIFTLNYNSTSDFNNEFIASITCAECNNKFEFVFKFDTENGDMMYLSDFVEQYNKSARIPKYISCPFCGCKNIDVEHVPDTKDEDHYTIYGYYKIYCKGCECSTPKCDSYDEAFKKWNTRIRKI